VQRASTVTAERVAGYRVLLIGKKVMVCVAATPGTRSVTGNGVTYPAAPLPATKKDTEAGGEPALPLFAIVNICPIFVSAGISPNRSGLGVVKESWSPRGGSPNDTT
jgi:hypothetical protein